MEEMRAAEQQLGDALAEVGTLTDKTTRLSTQNMSLGQQVAQLVEQYKLKDAELARTRSEVGTAQESLTQTLSTVGHLKRTNLSLVDQVKELIRHFEAALAALEKANAALLRTTDAMEQTAHSAKTKETQLGAAAISSLHQLRSFLTNALGGIRGGKGEPLPEPPIHIRSYHSTSPRAMTANPAAPSGRRRLTGFPDPLARMGTLTVNLSVTKSAPHLVRHAPVSAALAQLQGVSSDGGAGETDARPRPRASELNKARQATATAEAAAKSARASAMRAALEANYEAQSRFRMSSSARLKHLAMPKNPRPTSLLASCLPTVASAPPMPTFAGSTQEPWARVCASAPGDGRGRSGGRASPTLNGAWGVD
jgi:hypothetical protein